MSLYMHMYIWTITEKRPEAMPLWQRMMRECGRVGGRKNNKEIDEINLSWNILILKQKIKIQIGKDTKMLFKEH